MVLAVDLRTLSTRQRRIIRSKMMRAYCATYASETLRGPPEYDGRFLLGRHHIDWSDAINHNDRCLFMAARDHGKSHFFVLGYSLWQVQIRSPGRTGYIFSATQPQAEEHLDKIRKEIIGGGENGGPNPYLANLLPFKKDQARTLVFANNSEIRARGFGTKVRGGHPFWVLCDDILNDEHIWSETVRQKAVDYYLSAIEPMPVPGGQIVIVGTPFHALDLYGHLKEGREYTVLEHPARGPFGKPLWPARYNEERLARRKRIVGSIRWAREYMCQPITDDASLFPSWLFDADGIKQDYPLGVDAKLWHRQGMTVCMGVDLALSASAGADFFVCFIMAVDGNGTRYVVDIFRAKGLGYQQQVDTIVSLSKKYDCDLVFVEANQYQRVISDMVIRTSDAPIKAFYTTGRGGSRQASNQRRGMAGAYSSNKNNLDRGVPALRLLLENKKMRIPWAHATRERVQQWIGEMQQFGWAEGKMQGVGAHDDTVMALWMADSALQIAGSSSLLDSDGELMDGSEDFDLATWGLGDGGDNHPKPPAEEEDVPDWFGGRDNGGLPGLPGSLAPDLWS